MEQVLDTYAQPYDPKHPVLCMDEQPIQLLNETRVPIAATKEHPCRVDYEYERAGTASIFMFREPLSGWRQVTVRERLTHGTIDILRTETAAWRQHGNAGQSGVDWQFQVDDARVKLKSVYPKIIV